MELLLVIIGSLLTGFFLGDYLAFKRGFKCGQKDEQFFFGLILTRLSTKENNPDLLDKVTREYNITMMEIMQKVKDSHEGR